MELIKLVDYEGTTHFLNKEFIISVRPFFFTDDPRKAKIEYGTGFVDTIHMKEEPHRVASMIMGEYFK